MASVMSTTSRNDTTSSLKASRGNAHQVLERKGKEIVDDDDDFDENENEEGDVEMISEDAENVTLEASQDGSQGLTADVQMKLDEMQAHRQGRDKSRKQAVHKAYDEAYDEIREAITSHFDEHEAKASAAHEAQLARLKDLINQRNQIEALMAEKLRELRNDFIQHSTAFESVIEYRLKKTG